MSNKKSLWITRRLSEKTLERAQIDYDCVINFDDQPISQQELAERSSEFDAILPCHSEIFKDDLVRELHPRVKIIANHSVGTDHCDINALKARGITITNTPDVLSDATAEIAFLLMLGAARRAIEGDALVRNGDWDFWSPNFMVGKQVSGARLGIIGMGRVGQVMAKRARGFDMEVHYFNRKRLTKDAEHGAVYHSSLETLLPVSDFLSLHCPATAETIGLMNTKNLSKLPDGAILINSARGSLCDENAVLEAIRSGRLSAAGIDCFATEPGGNSEFAKHNNIFMLPHIGSATTKTRDAMGFRALDNLDAFFDGKLPQDIL